MMIFTTQAIHLEGLSVFLISQIQPGIGRGNQLFRRERAWLDGKK
jgi:hypothetical protein